MSSLALTQIRWQQAQLLLQENALDIDTMASCLGVESKKLETMLGAKPSRTISDALAQQMEQTFSKPQGWLSQTTDSGINYDLFGA